MTMVARRERKESMTDTVLRWMSSGWATLGVLGVVTVARGIMYLPPLVHDAGCIPALNVLPMPVWAGLWITVGAVAIIAAACRAMLPAAIGAVAGLHLLWALLYASAWLVGSSQRGYVTALSYFAIAWLVASYYARANPEGR